MRKKLLLGTTLLVAAMAVASAARAAPYGFASTTYNDFLVTLNGATADGGTISVNTNQNYPGSANTGDTVTESFTGGGAVASSVNALNAFGGPNATYNASNPAGVGTNSTPSPILESSLKGGFGAQAAASVGNAPVFSGTGDGSIGAVENGGIPTGGSLSATSSQHETVFTITANSGSPTVNFSFSAQAFVEAQTTKVGETASASTANTINEFLCSDAACDTTTLVGTFAPASLQLTVAAGVAKQDNTEGSQTAFSPFSETFSLTAGDTYQFNLSSQLTESTSSLAPVPEPASLAVLGTGVLALAGVMRRRRRRI